MRSGICSLQQALTPEAAAIVKQAVNLAGRRGHAQVTPLHVASAMFASSTGLLRRACFQSHSHPLQCKALELCFNVALNRLPASTSSPLLGHHHHSPHPSLSNALVAAFKRAQAHQRRGSIENQQQPILALKIEIEQLIISILDDPSVSRVMREAGFSSTQVKNKVEQAVSLEICSQTSTPSQSKEISTKPQLLCANVSQSLLPFSHFGLISRKPMDQVRNDDEVMSVLNTLVNKKRNIVIVGECLASTEGVVRGVMDKFERGNVLPGDFGKVQFINLPLFYLRNHSKEEVEHKIMELRCLVKSHMGRRVVLYLGDLKWVSEFWSNYGEQSRNYYSPVENIIMELKRLMSSGIGDAGRLWLIGVATFQTYIKCKTGHPSLESIWQLHPLTIPVDSLSLSLNLNSDLQTQSRSKVTKGGSSWPLLETEYDKHLTCCADCSVNFDKEARSIASSNRNNYGTTVTTNTMSTSSSLPPWLQQCKEESRTNIISDQQESIHVRDLCKKWNSFCSSVHKQPQNPEKVLTLSSSPSPPSSTSITSNDRNTNFHRMHLSWPAIFEPNNQFPKQHQVWISESSDEGSHESHLRNDHRKPDLLSNPNSSPNSASSSEAMDEDMDGLNYGFKEFNAENLKIICDALEKKVPWQKEVIPEIASTILECRSGMNKGKNGNHLKQREGKEETWLFFLGNDSKAKEKTARELAKVLFGNSQSNFISIGLSRFSSTRADSTDEESKNKRARDELGSSYLERFGEALNENPHRVFFMEDVEQIDHFSQKGIKQAIEKGTVKLPGGETVPLKDSIIIFSCESLSSLSRACSPSRRLKTRDQNEEQDTNEGEDRRNWVSLDLNIAIEYEKGDEYSVGDIGILEYVDKQIVFKIQELL